MKKANWENHDVNIREYGENGTDYNESTENDSLVVNEDEGNEESSDSMMILQTNQTDYDDDEICEIAEDRTTQEIYFMRQKNLSQRWTVFHLFVHKYLGKIYTKKIYRIIRLIMSVCCLFLPTAR